MKLRIGTIAALAAGLTLAASGSAFAQGKGHGHDKDKDHGRGRDDDNRQQQVYQNQQQLSVEQQRRIAYEQQRRAYEIQQRELRDQEQTRIAQQRRERDRYEYESRGNVGRIPPGLAKKPGGMPPGQYKKMYRSADGARVLRDVFIQRGYTVVRTQPYGESQYVYYRAPNGTLQRAIVSPGTNQLGFTNVPAELLQLVLSRLY